jgi:glutathione S-transferase
MTSLTLVRRIAARPSIVFDALTTPEGIALWWGPDSGPVLLAQTDARIGGRFRVRFRALSGTLHESSGEYLEIVRPERLAMSWRWEGDEDPGESRVEFNLRAIADGTELTLIHSRLHDETSRDSHELGWNGALDKLERHMEEGRTRMITVTALRRVPPFARGLVRDVRVRWALEEAGIPYREKLIGPEDQADAGYRALQPFGQVPAMESGDLKLFESGAIVIHIAERSDALMPPDPDGRARTSAWVFAALNTVEPHIQGLCELDIFHSQEAWAPQRRPAVVQAVQKRLTALENWLGERDYLENRFTAADLMMTTVLRILRHTDIVSERPRLKAYQDRCEARPAFKKALADHLRPFEALAG